MSSKLLKKFDFFKTSIAVSLLVIAISIAYFLLIILPSQQASKIESIPLSQSLLDHPTISPDPTATPTSSPVKVNTLSQLNQCLNNASAYKEDTLTKLLAWAESNNQNGEHNLTGAFDSIEVKYEQDRQDCFAKYPQ